VPQRPLSITILSFVLILAGAIGIGYHLSELRAAPRPVDVAPIFLLRILALVAGMCMLRGRNWARWTALLWLALHVAISAFHSVPELLMHLALLAVFGYFLLRRPAAEYFRAA